MPRALTIPQALAGNSLDSRRFHHIFSRENEIYLLWRKVQPARTEPCFALSMDICLFYFINQGWQNRLFDFLMPLLSQESYFRLPLAILWICLVVWGGRKERVVALSVLVLLIFSDQLSTLLKFLFKRPRPCHTLPGVHLLLGCSRSYSFPSNHASNVLAVAAYLAYFYRWLLWPAIFVSLMVGLSRVYVGVHYPSDVAGGTVLGLVCATLFVGLYKAMCLTLDRGRPDRRSEESHPDHA
jgi:undecaprenyl-diphosphatase